MLNPDNVDFRMSSESVVQFYAVDAVSAQFTLQMLVAARNREKFTKTPYFGSSKSFKVNDVDISKKLDASACYDKRHVCAYLQPFSRYTSQ